MITDTNNTNNSNSGSEIISQNEVIEARDLGQETIQSTQFTDAAPREVDSTHDNSVSATNVYKHPELTEYLSRPFPIASYTWTSTSAIGSKLSEVFLPQALIAQRSIAEKLSRFAYLKCKFKISVRVNGTSFHYGKLIVSYDVSPRSVGTLDYTFRDNIFSRSVFPHVIVSPGRDEIQEFMIPFIYPLDYFPLTVTSPSADYGTRYPMASVTTYVLNPLSSSTVVPPVSVTMYGSMYDIELAGYANSIPQSLFPALTNEDLSRFNNNVPTQFGLQEKPRPSIPQEEFEAQIGYTNMKLANPDLINTTHDPITLYMGETSSKPIEGDLPLGSLNDILSRPALLFTTTMTSAQAAGTDVFSIEVTPRLSSTSGSGPTIYYNTPLSFVSDRFDMWRGTLNYKLQIVCSSFHSARIQILYSPYGNTYETNEPFELLSRIVDIQAESEIKFSIPYTAIFPYMESRIGTLYFKVVNALTFKEEPVPDIYMNLWICGGGDMEFILPRPDLRLLPRGPTTPAILDTEEEFVAQIATGSQEAEYTPLAPFSSCSRLVTFTPATKESIISRSSFCQFMGGNRTNSTYSALGFSPCGAICRLSTSQEQRYAPSYETIAGMSRFRRGGMIYTIISHPLYDSTLETGASYCATELRTLIGASSFNGNQGYNYDGSATPPDDSLINGLSVRSSDLSLQPLTIRIPRCRTLNYDDNIYTDANATNLSAPFSIQSYARIYVTDRVDVFLAADKDMEFYFQIGPPVDVLP